MKRRLVLGFAAAATVGITGCTALQNGGPATTSGETGAATDTPPENMTATPLVRGTIVFESTQPPLTDATIYVQLEDISRADAAATVISRQVIRNPAEQATSDGIPFALHAEETDIKSQRRYSVAVHVDMDGTEDVTVGDYVSTDVNPVLTHGHPDTVTVSVEKVE